MNILMLGWELPPHNSGGLGVACYHMSKALSQQGAAVDFVLPYKAEHEDASQFMNILAATDALPLHEQGFGAYQQLCECYDPDTCDHEALASIQAIQRRYGNYVTRLVQQNTPDVIHAHDWLTMHAGARAKEACGAPLVAHVHATEFDRSGEHYGNPLVHEIERAGLHAADRIIAVSNITKNIIVREYDIPADKVDVIYNSVDLDGMDGSAADSTYTYVQAMRSHGYTVVSTVGRLTVQKGLGYFIRAAGRALEKYDHLLFLIAGSGEQRDELLQLTAALGISDKVLFTGFVRGKAWRDVYAVSDIFVMSSVSEPFGITALEAAHHNTALLISQQSGVGEVLHSVMRFHYWEVDRLADEIVGIAASPALSYELRQNVLHEYQRISWRDVAQQCLGQYQRAMQRRIAA